jgi:glycerophosphoryl diester phosphodiesterase
MNIVENIAHRGSSRKAPENTLAAFQQAILDQASAIELDVHLTLDGEIVVIHDEKIDRTTDGRGWVKDLTLSEIRQFSAGKWFSETHRAEKVPTLREVLEMIEQSSVWLNIELKNNIVPYPKLEESVVAEIEYFGMEKRVVISSFNHSSLVALHAFRPKIPLAALYEASSGPLWQKAKQLGVTAIHPYYLTVSEEMVERCHQQGLGVRPYTVDHPADLRRLIDWGVDGIITNVPDRLAQLLAKTEDL